MCSEINRKLAYAHFFYLICDAMYVNPYRTPGLGDSGPKKYLYAFYIIEAVLWRANETVTLRTSCHPEYTSGIFSVLHDCVNSKESEDRM